MDNSTILPVNQFNLEPNIEQIILVTAMPESSSGYLYAFEKNDKARWEQVLDTIPVVIGKYGMTANKSEGDGRSPLGLHKIGYAFGVGSKPRYIEMPYREITSSDKFIDDPESPDYNTWISGETDAKSYERMKRKDDSYDLGLVIEYNMNPVVPAKGSAIFIHIWRSSTRGTQGCVAMDRDDIETILEWLKPDKNPHLYILES